MSKYMTFDSDVFPSGELLVEALKAMGFAEVVTGDALQLQGWDKSDRRTAEIVVPRESGEGRGRRLFGDIGFRKTEAGYVPVIDDMDLTHNLGGGGSGFLVRLRNGYHEAAARQLARRLGGRITREKVGKTVKIRIRY